MDATQPTTPASTPTPTPAQPKPVGRMHNPNLKGKMIMLLMAVIFLLLGAGGGWYYRDSQAKKDLDAQKAITAALQLKNAQLTTDLAAATKTATPAPTAVRPSQATLDNIAASITSGNTAALEGYAASSVKVVIAASSGIGDRTPAQMVGDVAYVSKGTDPWNFDLSSTVLSGYQAGSYKQYFPTTAFVGKSANGYVISFQFDSAGKINGVFMAVPDVL